MTLRSLFQRSVVRTALLLTSAAVANAGSLYITFQGYIPTLTVNTDKLARGPSGIISDTPTTQTLSNVPFSGQFVLDSDRLGLVTLDPLFAPFALRSFTDTDPIGPINGVLGVDTDEWISGMLSLGGTVGVTLPFNRQLAGQAPGGAFVFEPFNGKEYVEYMDGRDNLTEPGLMFESGDVFGFAVQHAYSYAVNGPYTVGQEVGVGESSSLSMRILSSASLNPFAVIHFFGPGAPTSLSWADPVPGTCTGSDCNDGFYTGGSESFFSQSIERTFAIDPQTQTFEFDTAGFSGALLFTEVQASVVPTPEPRTAASLLLVAGVCVFRKRPARRV